MSRRRSDLIWHPEEPFMPTQSPDSVKFFCLFGLMGKKFTLRSIRELPGLAKAPQLLLGEAVLRTVKDSRRISSVLAAFAHMWRCRGAPLCSADVGRTSRHGFQSALASTAHLAEPQCLQPGSGETDPWQWEAAGREESSGTGSLVGVPRARHSH